MVPEQRVYVSKGWGFEDWIVNKPEYCGKLLFVKKGKKCSFHYHKIKDETFFIYRGKINLRVSLFDDIETAETVVLEEGETFHIPVGMRHQFEALLDTEIFEFSTQHFDSDSYRLIKGD